MSYERIGQEIGKLVDEKNKAYGDSFHKAGEILKVLYPEGIVPDQYEDMLYLVRVIDKQFRIATNKDAFGENPAKDIAGYSILKSLTKDNLFKKHQPKAKQMTMRVKATKEVLDSIGE